MEEIEVHINRQAGWIASILSRIKSWIEEQAH